MIFVLYFCILRHSTLGHPESLQQPVHSYQRNQEPYPITEGDHTTSIANTTLDSNQVRNSTQGSVVDDRLQHLWYLFGSLSYLQSRILEYTNRNAFRQISANIKS